MVLTALELKLIRKTYDILAIIVITSLHNRKNNYYHVFDVA